MGGGTTNYNLPMAGAPPQFEAIGDAEMRRKGSQRGSLVKRGDMYYAKYRHWVINSDGVREWLPTTISTGHSAKKPALDKLGELVREANAPSSIARGTSTVADYFADRFQPLRKETKAKGTWLTDASTFRTHIHPALGSIRLNELRPDQIEMLLAVMRKKGKGHGTLHACQSLISAIWKHAKKNRYVSGVNPASEVEMPIVEKRKRRALSWLEVLRLNEHVPAYHRQLIIILAVTGLRIGEALGLRWQWVNLSEEKVIVDGESIPRRTLAVREQRTHGETKTILKRRNSYRLIPLEPLAIEALRNQLKMPVKTGAVDLVFPNTKGNYGSYHNMNNRVLGPAGVAANIGHVHCHILRHTASTRWDEKGLSARQKNELLGNNISEQVYTHAWVETIRERLEGNEYCGQYGVTQ